MSGDRLIRLATTAVDRGVCAVCGERIERGPYTGLRAEIGISPHRVVFTVDTACAKIVAGRLLGRRDA